MLKAKLFPCHGASAAINITGGLEVEERIFNDNESLNIVVESSAKTSLAITLSLLSLIYKKKPSSVFIFPW